MKIDVEKEVAALRAMTAGQLCERYAELFGEKSRTRHKAYLIRKIAWRIQANAEGDLSERARRQAEELANDADVRVTPPRGFDGRSRPAKPMSTWACAIFLQNPRNTGKTGCENGWIPSSGKSPRPKD